MRFSEQWLREWVDPDLSTDELAEQLTMAGLEVETVEPVAPKFDGVVIGKVLAVASHPDAGKLHVCEVDAGQAQPLQIVCGAANVRVGMYAPVALVGAYLPGDVRIRRTRLRGVESEGMLCSAHELGLCEDAGGILELTDGAHPGKSLKEFLRLDDNSIELALTPNRGDCLGISGIAREVGMLNRMPVKVPVIKEIPQVVEDSFPVQVEAVSDCPCYAGRVILDIDPAAETPLWMRERLRRCGLRSLSPIVDITNYVLLEYGQPMHAFDLDSLEEEIVVRHSREGESLTLLDDQCMELQVGTLVIADRRRVVALAGIMGGKDTAMRDTTRNLFLESAFFSPMAIAGRARQYGMHTDSSHRFERGVNPGRQRQAIEHATRLLLDITGGRPGPVIECVDPERLPQRESVTLRLDRIRRVLGMEPEPALVSDCLTRLGMTVKTRKDGWRVIPPGFRFDITHEEDLIEEVGRILGYASLPVSRPRANLTIPAQPEGRVSRREIRQLLVERGYHEAITYSFVDPDLQQRLDPVHAPLKLINPLSSELTVMRTSLWPGLLQALRYNLRRQQERVRLFELGVRYLSQDDVIKEENTVAAVATGSRLPEQWDAPNQVIDFFDIKADIDALLGLTGRSGEFIFTRTTHTVLHPGQGADVIHNGRPVGCVGVLHPEVGHELELAGPVLLFELSLSAVENKKIPEFRELSRYPSIRRDIAIVVDDTITIDEVRDSITATAGGLLQNLQLFDVYTGEGIDLGRKSLALGLTLQDSSRTLTDEGVDAVLDRVVKNLQQKLNATLRE